MIGKSKMRRTKTRSRQNEILLKNGNQYGPTKKKKRKTCPTGGQAPQVHSLLKDLLL
jgi:hypothetical protein